MTSTPWPCGTDRVRRVRPEPFYRITYAVLFVIGLKLILDGADKTLSELGRLGRRTDDYGVFLPIDRGVLLPLGVAEDCAAATVVFFLSAFGFFFSRLLRI